MKEPEHPLEAPSNWSNLIRLQECGEDPSAKLSQYLETEWNRLTSKASEAEKRLPGSSSEFEVCSYCRKLGAIYGSLCEPCTRLLPFDAFFAWNLNSLKLVFKERELRDQWWPRLVQYFNDRVQFRDDFRARKYRGATRETLARFKAVFDVWDLCVVKEARNTARGRFFKSYQLELAALLAPTWDDRENLFRKACTECLSTKDRPIPRENNLYIALRRRAYVLASHLRRVQAFGILNTNQPNLAKAEHYFRRSLALARKAHQEWKTEEDRHPNYLAFWVEALRFRRAQVECDPQEARSAYQEAKRHLETFISPDRLFIEPHFWYSVSDFERESYLIDGLAGC